MARFRRVKQPPIDRLGRPSEFRPRWWGVGLAIGAAVLLVLGFQIRHSIADTIDGKYHENWLVQNMVAPRSHPIYPQPAQPAGQAVANSSKAAELDLCPT